jgi:TolA-binding protein
MQCDDIRGRETAVRYVQRGLSDAEREAYEKHFFVCEACLAELETQQGLRTALPRVSRPGRALAWAGALAACLLLGLGLRWGMKHYAAPPPQVAQVPKPAPTAERPSLLALAEFAPPAYAAVQMRGTESEAARSYRTAMEWYQKGDYGRASSGLARTVAIDRDDPAARFYLGVSQLLDGRNEDGIQTLRATVAMGESDFREPARFYLAKALLKAGDAAQAREQLQAVAGASSPLQDEARRLLDRLTP